MEPLILDSGSTTSEMDLVHSFGLILQDMKDSGLMTRQMVKVNWFMLMATSMKVNG